VLALSTLSSIARMAVYIPVFAATYLTALRLFFGPLLRDVVLYLPKANRVHRLLGYAEAV